METRTASWSQLPPEVRLMVMNELVLGAQGDGGRLAPYAAVNSEWQAFIERITLRSLKLTPSRLGNPAFVAMVNRAWGLNLLHHLSLFIPLTKYDCSRCGEIPEAEEWERDMATIWDTLNAAFTLLSTWTPKGHLSLDITVQSPSDASHHFKLVHLDRAVPATAFPVHDPHHGWEKGGMVTLPPEDAFFRVFEDIEFSAERWRELPQVTAVTALYLRRQTTRRWEPREVRELAEHLVGLQEIYHESWREWGLGDRNATDRDTRSCLFEPLHLAAGNLTKLVLFEDFSDLYIRAFQFVSLHGATEWLTAEPVRTPNRAVGEELARVCARLPHLSHLSASFLVDGRHFLPALLSLPASPGTGSWSKLATLALTSRELAPNRPAARVNDLLKIAAAVAARLPALTLLEVWNGGRGIACVFRYQAASSASHPNKDQPQPSSASITWRASWDVQLEDRVIKAWREAACKHHPCTLRVVEEVGDNARFPAIRAHGDAIRELGFSHDVVHPTSLSQILWENMS